MIRQYVTMTAFAVLVAPYIILMTTGCAPGWSISLTPGGAMLKYESPQFASQMQGVAKWTDWLSKAPASDVEAHLPGVTKWVNDLNKAVVR